MRVTHILRSLCPSSQTYRPPPPCICYASALPNHSAMQRGSVLTKAHARNTVMSTSPAAAASECACAQRREAICMEAPQTTGGTEIRHTTTAYRHLITSLLSAHQRELPYMAGRGEARGAGQRPSQCPCSPCTIYGMPSRLRGSIRSCCRRTTRRCCRRGACMPPPCHRLPSPGNR